MINLPRRGATDILLKETCQKLLKILDRTGIALRLDGDWLYKTVQGYATAY